MPTLLKKELLVFCKPHWPHVVGLLPAVFLVTIIHEAAHCAAVVFQGGDVTEFVFIPGGGNWGHMSYTFPEGAVYSSVAISLAPYVLWSALALLAVVLCMRNKGYPFWVASTIFVWLFVVPLADIANTAGGYVLGGDNDFSSAFGPPTLEFLVLTAICMLVCTVAAFFVQKRLYRARGLSLKAFVVLSGILAAAAAAVAMQSY